MVGQVKRLAIGAAAKAFAQVEGGIGQAHRQTEYGRAAFFVRPALKHLLLVGHEGQFIVRRPAG